MGRPLLFVALRACYGRIAAPLVSKRGTAAVDCQKQAPLVSNRGTAAVGTWSQHTSKDKDAGWSGMSCNADGGQGQAPSVSNRGTAAVDAFVIGSKV